MFSGQSHSALVMKRLTPSMCQVPSGCWCAVARPAPTSEPASGSVSTMVAPQCRSMMTLAYACWAALPIRSRMAAKPGPLANM